MVEVYIGNNIDRDKIEKLKDIAITTYPQEIYNGYFKNIRTVGHLAYLHGVPTDEEHLVIGTDWFLCYSINDYCVEILEWVSINNKNKMKQVSEMMSVLKQLFFKNNEKEFIADMRHDTSYQMYLKFFDKGYFKEFTHKCVIDCDAPIQVDNIKAKYLEKYKNIEEFLSSDDSKNYTEYFKYVLHCLTFMVTDKFVKKYDKATGNKLNKVLKK